jgi:hypothetical protein
LLSISFPQRADHRSIVVRAGRAKERKMQRLCRLLSAIVLGLSIGGTSACPAQSLVDAPSDGPTPELPLVADPVPAPETIPLLGGQRPVMAPNMIGDFSGGFLSGGAFKIADNESPRPVDRLFATYQYFNDVLARPSKADLHQEVFGFEKVLLDGYASVGLRAPVFEMQGDGSASRSDFGDLSLLLKYAWLDTRAGDAVSTGLVVTVPTGPNFTLADGTSLHPVILQPYMGGLFNLDRFYLHGFMSLAVPMDARDAVLLFNDVGIGYRFYQSRDSAVLSFVIPTVEAHVNTPLNHRGSPRLCVAGLDEVVLTYGVHLGLFKKAQLSLGIATPVTGPLTFDVEALAELNWRF